MNALYDIIGIPFGYLMMLIYHFVDNYAVAIIIFTVVTKIILLPVNYKTQKNAARMQLLNPKLEKLRKECAEWAESEEDVLSYAQFGQVAVKFFEKRRDAKFGLDGKHGDAEKQVHPV